MPDEISVDFWKYAGEAGLRWLTDLFNVIFKTARMFEAWRWNLGEGGQAEIEESSVHFGESVWFYAWSLNDRDNPSGEEIEVRGVPVAYIRAIKEMYGRGKTRVRTAGGDSGHFSVEIGLHQGSTLSPFLFEVVMDVLMRSIQGEVPWCMLFADDVVLSDETWGCVNEKLK
ncbi:uncharacterized protein LOC124892942, partial [Capsicum annuum]|uniref:uncharacterized protein LOC124892942 n=1 Tax=Capsicum annuum TaxID=4072 RepID=UPI001FB1674A